MNSRHRSVAEKIAQQFSLLPQVQAVAVAGSQASGAATDSSDIDIYIYSTDDIPAEVRTEIGSHFSDDVHLNDFWGAGNEWTDRETGIHIDAMFWTTAWIEDQLDRLLVRHEASMGYTTCFWHTIKVSQTVFDRSDWFHHLQQRTEQDYPPPLVKAIIANNYPVLRQIPSSYLHQLEKAAERSDLVSLNHRTAALLASYFDILFAVNRVLHPGEKRLIEFAEKLCPLRPAAMREQVSEVIEANMFQYSTVGAKVNQLIDGLDEVLGNLPYTL